MENIIKKGKSMLLIALIIISGSCKNELAKKQKMLSYGNKLWQVDRPKENRRGSFSYYRFTEDGKWLVYRKNRGEKGYWQPDMGDIELIQSWQLLNDSVMNVGGMNYKILTLSDAALAYADPGGNDTLKLFFKGDKLP